MAKTQKTKAQKTKAPKPLLVKICGGTLKEREMLAVLLDYQTEIKLDLTNVPDTDPGPGGYFAVARQFNGQTIPVQVEREAASGKPRQSKAGGKKRPARQLVSRR